MKRRLETDDPPSERQTITEGRRAWLRCDFHIHTGDTGKRLSVPQVVDLYGSLGFDVICITDHVYDKATVSSRIQSGKSLYGPTLKENFGQHMELLRTEAVRAKQQYDMLVLPGVELTNKTRKYHIGVIDAKDYIDPDLPLQDIVRQIHEQNACAIALHAHPTKRGSVHLWEHRHEYASLFDAWEVGNRDCLYSLVGEEGYNHIAGSDFHKISDMYAWKTLLYAKKNAESIKEAIIRNEDVAIYLYRKPQKNNDLTLGLSEFIVYACPVGELADQIQAYFERTSLSFGKNGAHAYMPHCSLTGFFKDHESTVPMYVKALNESLRDTDFRQQDAAIQVCSMKFGKRVHKLVLHSPWLSLLITDFVSRVTSHNAPSPLHQKSNLHLSLAYGFDPEHWKGLVEAAEELINPQARAGWELRFYQRNPGNSWTCHMSWPL